MYVVYIPLVALHIHNIHKVLSFKIFTVDIFGSTEGAICSEQAFGRCHHHCRESRNEVSGYECFCEKGYVLQGKFDCMASSKLVEEKMIYFVT